MINIYIKTPQGDNFSTKVAAVPRIGETVKLVLTSFKVVDVIYTLEDRYTEGNIAVILEN